MTSGAEGKVWRVCSLRDDTPTVVNSVLGVGFWLFEAGLLGVPTVRVPNLGVDEVRVELRGEPRRRHECVRGGDNVVGAVGHKRLLDLAHNGVNRGVNTEGFLDDLSVQRQLGKVFVCQGGEILSESRLLLLKELFDEAGVLSQTEEDPSDGRGGRVLTSHQKRNHDTSDLVLRDLCAILVLAVQQVPYHIVLALLSLGLTIPAPADDIGVQLDHSLTCVVTRTVVGKRGPGEHEVDGREAHVKIVVQFGKARVEGVTDLLALERAGGSVDGELSHDLGDIESALLSREGLVALDEVLGFFGDDGNVGAEGILGKTKLDELDRKLAVCNADREPVSAHLLLLHQLGVGAVVYNILAKDRSGEGAVDLLGVDILDLSVEDKVVACGVEANGHLATKEDEGEDIAILHPVSAFPS